MSEKEVKIKVSKKMLRWIEGITGYVMLLGVLSHITSLKVGLYVLIVTIGVALIIFASY